MKPYKSILISSSFAIIMMQPMISLAKDYQPNFSSAQLTKDIKILGSDEFEGRGVGTPAETKTEFKVTHDKSTSERK